MEASVLPFFGFLNVSISRLVGKVNNRRYVLGLSYHRFSLLFDKHLFKIMFIRFKFYSW